MERDEYLINRNKREGTHERYSYKVLISGTTDTILYEDSFNPVIHTLYPENRWEGIFHFSVGDVVENI